MIKKLYFLSAISLFNFALVAIIANSQVPVKTNVPTPSPQIIINKVIKKEQSKVNSPIKQQTQVTSVAVTNSCIVTVDGVRYDITNFKNMHSGGDVFSCGSDMSATFWNQHSQKQLSQMQKYRI